MEIVTSQRRDVMAELVGLVMEMIEWEIELTGQPTRETLLVEDLGFQSLDVVMLILAIEGHFERRELPFDELLTIGDDYVSDLALGQIADFLEAQLAKAPEARGGV